MDPKEFQVQYEIEETHWWFKARRRLVRRFAEQVRRELGRPLRILDVACATAMSFRFLSDLGAIRGLDISTETIRFARQRGVDRIVRGDAQDMPFREASFDLVVALDAFEHFPEDARSMGEVRRVLAPGGALICTVPAFRALWSPHDDAFHHLRRYTRRELKDKLAQQALRIERLSYYSMLLAPPLFVFRKTRQLLGRGKEARSDFTVPIPAFIERGLGAAMAFEAWLLERVDLPFGASLICLCRKE
ncbi:MAG: methyltransferase domain-containing protein [Planctomycetes bacterium]|nr:methyltransferase domain-containing protein [Planctomycetota bacterium]